MTHYAMLKDGMWRIMRRVNGYHQNICGAETEVVAWAQCRILDAMRR